MICMPSTLSGNLSRVEFFAKRCGLFELATDARRPSKTQTVGPPQAHASGQWSDVYCEFTGLVFEPHDVNRHPDEWARTA